MAGCLVSRGGPDAPDLSEADRRSIKKRMANRASATGPSGGKGRNLCRSRYAGGKQSFMELAYAWQTLLAKETAYCIPPYKTCSSLHGLENPLLQAASQ